MYIWGGNFMEIIDKNMKERVRVILSKDKDRIKYI
jgi:hypothetical protein